MNYPEWPLTCYNEGVQGPVEPGLLGISPTPLLILDLIPASAVALSLTGSPAAFLLHILGLELITFAKVTSQL